MPARIPSSSVLHASGWDPKQLQDQHQRTFLSLSLNTYQTTAPHLLPSLSALSQEPALLLEITPTTASHVEYKGEGHSLLADSA